MRQVRGGDLNDRRFVIMSEKPVAGVAGGFVFSRVGGELTLLEVCAALIPHGLSEQDATALISEAEGHFSRKE